MAGDVKDAAGLAGCVEQVVKALGGIQILVNNAQEVPLGSLHDVTEEQLQAPAPEPEPESLHGSPR